MKVLDGFAESAISKVEKFEGDIVWEERNGVLVPMAAAGADRGRVVTPFEVVEKEHNALFYGGSSNLWQYVVGNGTGTAAQVLTWFNNANAALGVGDSATANALGDNDLTAATNKLRRAMDATYPLHSPGVVVGARDAVFRSTFATADANWVWNEWGTFNSPTAATGRMLNRVVTSLGTKTSAATWVLTVTLTLA